MTNNDTPEGNESGDGDSSEDALDEYDSRSQVDLPFSESCGRGLLTANERKGLAGEKSDSYRQNTRRKVHNRIALIENDLEYIKENAPDIYKELKLNSELVSGADISKVESDIEEIKEMQRELLESSRAADPEKEDR